MSVSKITLDRLTDSAKINRAFVRMDGALKKYRAICLQGGCRLWRVSFNVYDDGQTSTAVRFRKAKKNA